MPKHYKHLEPMIITFFKEKGWRVEVEPSGSRGPDIRGNGCVGEIKHEKELCRDLHCAYWTNWNSTKQRFGGKTYNYCLAEHAPAGVQHLSDRAKGWVAVICGQLRYMTIQAQLTEGWLIYENFYSFESSLMEAVSFLRKKHVIKADTPDHRGNVGFLLVKHIDPTVCATLSPFKNIRPCRGGTLNNK